MIRTAVSGTHLRIRLSNAYGTTPLRPTGARSRQDGDRLHPSPAG
ncbi:hypothetical protein [Nonomuraea sp. NPDC050310]